MSLGASKCDRCGSAEQPLVAVGYETLCQRHAHEAIVAPVERRAAAIRQWMSLSRWEGLRTRVTEAARVAWAFVKSMR